MDLCVFSGIRAESGGKHQRWVALRQAVPNRQGPTFSWYSRCLSQDWLLVQCQVSSPISDLYKSVDSVCQAHALRLSCSLLAPPLPGGNESIVSMARPSARALLRPVQTHVQRTGQTTIPWQKPLSERPFRIQREGLRTCGCHRYAGRTSRHHRRATQRIALFPGRNQVETCDGSRLGPLSQSVILTSAPRSTRSNISRTCSFSIRTQPLVTGSRRVTQNGQGVP